MTSSDLSATTQDDNVAVSPVERAIWILKAVAGLEDKRLTDIARHCGLHKTTALRLIGILEKEGLLRRDPDTRQYALGPEIARLGLAARELVDWRAIVRPALMHLSSRWGDTSIFSVLSNVELVCVDLQTGAYPIQANYQQVGSRRSLGAGSSGIAVLSALPEEARRAAFQRITGPLEQFPEITPDVLDERVTFAQTHGYATLLHAVVPEMGGIAVPVRDATGWPVGALSMPSLVSRIVTREQDMAASLKEEAARIEQAIATLAIRAR
ncbi:IclR family transcriptional regulator [Bordetella sp. LUAb4]|uniref:IclR family transcriptional regulator n=1 Tax=Bordetella sp. LUAb4 TaxID=2843195 RepID=UPI001E531D2B|nr:IclR family transcriptional regulator [Bordetella sp. LUAb4]